MRRPIFTAPTAARKRRLQHTVTRLETGGGQNVEARSSRTGTPSPVRLRSCPGALHAFRGSWSRLSVRSTAPTARSPMCGALRACLLTSMASRVRATSRFGAFCTDSGGCVRCRALSPRSPRAGCAPAPRKARCTKRCAGRSTDASPKPSSAKNARGAPTASAMRRPPAPVLAHDPDPTVGRRMTLQHSVTSNIRDVPLRFARPGARLSCHRHGAVLGSSAHEQGVAGGNERLDVAPVPRRTHG